MKRHEIRLLAFAVGFSALTPLVACDGSSMLVGQSGSGGQMMISDAGDDTADGPVPSGATCSVLHRATREVCAATVFPASCQTDADCPADPWAGHCVPSGQCSYDQCTTDTDCAQPAACLCQGQWRGFSARSQGNMCGSGNCQVDSDCGGAYCSPTATAFYGISGYFCHTPRDQCLCNGDCSGGLLCQYDRPLAGWSCADPGGAG
jgi:hypothetical protein